MRIELKCDADPQDTLGVVSLGESVSFWIDYGESSEALAVRLDGRAKVETLRDALNEWLGDKGPVAPFAFHYEFAGCVTADGPQNWRNEFERGRPPQFMVDAGRVRSLKALHASEPLPVVDIGGSPSDGYLPWVVNADGDLEAVNGEFWSHPFACADWCERNGYGWRVMDLEADAEPYQLLAKWRAEN